MKSVLALAIVASLIGCNGGEAPISDKDSMAANVQGLKSGPGTPKGGQMAKIDKAETEKKPAGN